MRHFFIGTKLDFVAVLLLAFIPACTQRHGNLVSEAVSASGEAGRIDQAFLWSMEKAGKRSYLFGTIHMGVDASKELPQVVWDSFEASSCFVMEADLQAVEVGDVYAMTLQPQGRKLSDELSPLAWETLKAKLKGEVSEPMLQRSQAWFISLLLLREYTIGGLPMDEMFALRARDQGKSMYVLEDWRDAIKVYASITSAKQLEAMILSDDESEHETARLINAYRSGDENQLLKAIAESQGPFAPSDAAMDKLLGERNKAWLPVLEASAKDGNCFVAVGAGHLVGKDNLRLLLEQRGYKVVRF